MDESSSSKAYSEKLPPRQVGEHVWDSALGATPEAWSANLTPEELNALHDAAASVIKASSAGSVDTTSPDPEVLSLAAVDAAVSALPAWFIDRLHRLRDDQLLRGCGFAVLRGVPVALWGDALSAAAFLVISRALGELRPQNGAGHVLGHVTDLGLSSADPNVRVYQTSERQTFHTDSCDIVGLLMLRPAVSGGDSFLVSAGAIFNAMLDRCPELLRLLFEPLATDRRGEVPAGQKPYFEIPVFSYEAGFLNVIYQRQYLDSAQRFPDAPRLTPQHVAALDAFDALANDPALQVKMTLAPGDTQLVHNHPMLHDRSAFVDGSGPATRRHLLRAWIAPVSAAVRPLPAVFAQRFGTVAPGRRGGVQLEGVPPVARWAPPPRADAAYKLA